MISKVNLFIPILFVLIIMGCKNEPIEKELDNKIVIDTTSDDYSIKIHSEHKLTSYTSENLSIDLDGDHRDDFKIWKSFDASPGGLYRVSSGIEILNPDLFFLHVEKNDSIAIYTNDSKTKTYHENYDGSKNYNNSLNILVLTGFYPKILSQKISFSKNDSFTRENLILTYHDMSYYPNSEWNVINGNWDGVKNKFIGFKLLKGNKTYLGWIYLSVLSVSEIHTKEILLKEVN